jgi:hypothetical protein
LVIGQPPFLQGNSRRAQRVVESCFDRALRDLLVQRDVGDSLAEVVSADDRGATVRPQGHQRFGQYPFVERRPDRIG